MNRQTRKNEGKRRNNEWKNMTIIQYTDQCTRRWCRLSSVKHVMRRAGTQTVPRASGCQETVA
eukprot:5494111-Pyramimonas_sp.AAC.1